MIHLSVISYPRVVAELGRDKHFVSEGYCVLFKVFLSARWRSARDTVRVPDVCMIAGACKGVYPQLGSWRVGEKFSRAPHRSVGESDGGRCGTLSARFIEI